MPEPNSANRSAQSWYQGSRKRLKQHLEKRHSAKHYHPVTSLVLHWALAHSPLSATASETSLSNPVRDDAGAELGEPFGAELVLSVVTDSNSAASGSRGPASDGRSGALTVAVLRRGTVRVLGRTSSKYSSSPDPPKPPSVSALAFKNCNAFAFVLNDMEQASG